MSLRVSDVFPAFTEGQLHIVVQVKMPGKCAYSHIFIRAVLIDLPYHCITFIGVAPRLSLTPLFAIDVPPSPYLFVNYHQLSRPRKKQKSDEVEGRIEFSGQLLILLTVGPAGSWRTLWEQTWNRKEDAVLWFYLRKTERDNTSTENVPEYCWVFSPSDDIASTMDINPATVLSRDDSLRAFSELFTSSGLGIFTPNFDCVPGATFPIFFFWSSRSAGDTQECIHSDWQSRN